MMMMMTTMKMMMTSLKKLKQMVFSLNSTTVFVRDFFMPS